MLHEKDSGEDKKRSRKRKRGKGEEQRKGPLPSLTELQTMHVLEMRYGDEKLLPMFNSANPKLQK